MKKILSIALALALCLSLGACGGSADTPVTDPEEALPVTDAPTEETAPAGPAELLIGQTCSLPAFDITITGFDFSEKATSPDKDGITITPKEGYVTANLYYNVKYTGKATFYTSNLSPSWLVYGDGYTFNLERFYYYDAALDAWLNSGDIAPLTPEFPCKASFFVPEEVMNEKSNPLVIEFYENEVTFTPRPATEEGKELIYTYCMERLYSDVWEDVSTARSLMLELDTYKDSAMTARVHCFTYDDREYFTSHTADLTPADADSILSVLNGNTFTMRNNYGGDNNGNHTIVFQEDGTLDANYTYNGEVFSMYEAWRAEDGTVICSHTFDGKTKDYRMGLYQLDQDNYLLICADGDWCDCSMRLTISE